jgi:very-short-patch-repair endonuclease
MNTLTPQQFVENWRGTTLRERQTYQIHFMDVCRMVGHEAPNPSGVDVRGNALAFDYGVKKDTGSQGFADVFYEGHFAVEYKGAGKHIDLQAALNQLKQYREQLNNPPLLVVCDIENWEIHTNFNNAPHTVYAFRHHEILEPRVQRWLRAMFEEPQQLHPHRNTEQVTKDAASAFQAIADNMRQWQAAPERIAHFLTKLVFCLFAEDVGLLPITDSGRGIFSEIVEQTHRKPQDFVLYVTQLFEAMRDGGKLMFHDIRFFNGQLFEDVTVEELSLEALAELRKACNLDWSAVEPAIFGTLFERSLDPSKRAQLGAHYTSRDDILLIVEPVLMQPLRREWAAIQQEAAPLREKYDEALKTSNRRNIQTTQTQLLALRERMLERLREVKVLDPACGSGNFLYVSLQLLMDMEKAVITDPLFAGMQSPFPVVHPRQMYGIEVNVIAHDLASIVAWIGWIQWRQNNGYLVFQEPVLEPLADNFRLMDAILETPPPAPPPRVGEGSGDEGKRVGVGSGDEGEDIGAGSQGWAHTNTPPELYESIKLLSREMRSEPTPAEEALWQRLRHKQIADFKFRRQHSIDRFIVDFYCADARLVVEVDGPIHEQQQEYDVLRQAFVESLGIRVIRFTNADVLQNINAVVERIGEVLLEQAERLRGSTLPSPTHSPSSSLPSPTHWGGAGGGVHEPAWPNADVIVGNPPFLGDKKMRGELGDEYVDRLRAFYEGRVPGMADLVCYWFEKARAQIEQGKAKRAGLLVTNSIRGGANREVLERIKATGDIFMAWSDRDWVLEGAAVRVSMVGFDNGEEVEKRLDGLPAATIHPDLTATINITAAKPLEENRDIAFQGPGKVGDFDIPNQLAQEMLRLSNKSGLMNSDVVKPYMNGDDVVKRDRNYWIIDFGLRSQEEAASYEAPFRYLEEHVKEFRLRNNDYQRRTFWWRLGRSGEEYKQSVLGLKRQIFTSQVAKHRIFAWISTNVMPANTVIAIARDDDYFFGVLHSRLHEAWSLRLGTSLEDRPRYTPTTTFETFPFPWPPGHEDTSSPAYQAIAAAARQLHEERDAWLNPTPTPPQRIGEGRRGGVQDRTLTNLYNALNVWRGKESIRVPAAAADFAPRLDELHRALDQAVCDAYGWPHDILQNEDEILRRLLALNLERANAAP